MIRGAYIEGAGGKLLVVIHTPAQESDNTVIIVPAFGEEMNKSRRLVWETSRALCSRGISVLVPDLFGTGDSQGKFDDATWEIWLGDLECVIEYARLHTPGRQRMLAVRSGSVLLAALDQVLDISFDKALLWQPVYKGADTIRQMLRMRIMALRMSGQRTSSLEEMRKSLLSGGQSEVLGGYSISSKLARSLEAAEFCPSRHSLGSADGLIIEIGSGQSPTNVGAKHSELRKKGSWKFDLIGGERFWIAAEPGTNMELIEKSVSYLSV